MSLSELCSEYVKTPTLKDEVERNIIEFCESTWGLGLGTSPELPPLFPVQKFILKCYYNVPLDDKEHRIIIKDRFNEQELFRFTEIEYLAYLRNEGRINIKEVTGDPKDNRPHLILIIGRRGFKTSTIAIISAFENYKLLKKYCPQQYYGIPGDAEIRVSCIATNQEQASELFRQITGHVERADCFKRFRNKPTMSYMQLRSQRDIDKYGQDGRPSIRIVASPCSGRGIRGRNNIVAIMDEMAYFFESDSSDDKSDKNIYEAVTPSVAKFNSPEGEPHGRIICISSPHTKSGKFHEIYQRSMESTCNDLLMIQAPTWEIDYTLSPKFLRSRYYENPVSFMAEFGAEFSDRVTGWIENEQVLRVNIIPGLREKTQSYERIPHFMGTDIGLKNDGTAVAITHIVKENVGGILKDCIELDCAEVRYAKDEGKEYFSPEEMADWFDAFTKKFFITKGVLDQYYGMAILPLLKKKGHHQFEILDVTRELSSRIYQNLMSKMLDASLRIPEGVEREVDGKRIKDLDLVREMLRLRCNSPSGTNKYIIVVEAPELKGIHDDLSDAYARSVYLSTEFLSGGGSGRSDANAQGGSPNMTYHKYYLKQKQSAIYTNRPSSSVQMDMARGIHMGSKSGLMSPYGGGRRRGF